MIKLYKIGFYDSNGSLSGYIETSRGKILIIEGKEKARKFVSLIDKEYQNRYKIKGV